jgi:hypothetical protein
MRKGERVMKLKSLLFSLTLLTIFLLTSLVFSQDAKREGASWKEMLSYTEDQTWYAKKDWKNGLSEVTQSRQAQPWRMATWEEKVNYFISRLQKGDRKAFLYVEYALLDGYGNPYSHRSVRSYPTMPGKLVSQGVIHKLHAMAKAQNTKIEKVLTKGDPKVRVNVVRAVLSGLFNKDPRVRLVATNLLRRLRPDAMMARDVRRALLLETVTTERSKWREKDIDIPSIEEPRLGYDAQTWSGAGAPTYLHRKYVDGSRSSITDLLNGNGKGLYLTQGLYSKTERNDFPVQVRSYDYSRKTQSNPRTVWTKASLLRYGADEHVSNFESQYGFADKETMPKHVYLYCDYRDPVTGKVGENLYYGFHSVWEEMKKLDLFVTRVIWTARVKRDINALRIVSKDTFRTLADQIDGESLTYVPFKSPKFKIFGEAEARQIIVGMLENRVVSTREECVRFLKRLFDNPETSTAIKREIKKALREARRRELIIDTIRGRHLHAELLVPAQPSDWWGGYDEVDTSVWVGKNVRGKRLQMYRNQVQFPEETDVIYHDRRKPGAEDLEGEGELEGEGDDMGGLEGEGDDMGGLEGEGDLEGEGEMEGEGEGTSTGAEAEKTKYDTLSEPAYGHPLLYSEKDGEIPMKSVKAYFDLQKFADGSDAIITEPKKEESKPAEGEGDAMEGEGDGMGDLEGEGDDMGDLEGEGDDMGDLEGEGEELGMKGARELPGQYPGLLKKQEAKDPNAKETEEEWLKKRSRVATRYEKTRAVEILHSLLLANGSDLLKASYLDLQNAVNLITQMAVEDKRENEWLAYLLAGAMAADGQGRRYHGHKNLGAELDRTQRTRAKLGTLTAAIRGQVGQFSLEKGNVGLKADDLAKYRKEYYQNLPESVKTTTDEQPPGRSGDDSLEGKYPSKRDLAEKRYGKYYGHGRGGYYGFYDQQHGLKQAENDAEKLALGFYKFQSQWKLQRNKIVKGLLTALGDKDPQKRLLIIHLLRRLIPDVGMLPRVNKLLRELETVDKRPYSFISTYVRVKQDGTRALLKQEKIVGHELLKLQRFIVRRILVNKIKGQNEPDFLKEIPKGSFLTLVVRIDAEWDPYRIPLRTPIPRNAGGTNGMFFVGDDIAVIKGGLENRNFLVQRETARWIVDFYNYNRGTNYISASSGAGKNFVKALKFAERRDIVYYERNYVQWKYTDNKFNKTIAASTAKKDPNDPKSEYGQPTPSYTVKKGTDVYGTPVGRIAVKLGTYADTDIFRSIDEDRRVEWVQKYGRGTQPDLNRFEELKTPANEVDKMGDVRRTYRALREARDAKKAKLEGGKDKDAAARDADNTNNKTLDFAGQ